MKLPQIIYVIKRYPNITLHTAYLTCTLAKNALKEIVKECQECHISEDGWEIVTDHCETVMYEIEEVHLITA